MRLQLNTDEGGTEQYESRAGKWRGRGAWNFFFFFLVTASACRELWRAVRAKSSASISPRRRSGRNN